MKDTYTNPASGISYTNKDFNSIYTEELDLVKSLSPKWDPTISNESDPGVVLLKENAILADKENYNIDKNILETFPDSVSQFGNAKQLYDARGYNMHWYRAATTVINYSYVGTQELAISGVQLPDFTMVSDDSGRYVYTLINPSIIAKRRTTYSSNALQGVAKDFEANGSTTVTLDMLDADYRIYFTDTLVAENGIFIKFTTSEDWTRWEIVDNLESELPGQLVYKFGVLPNSNTCYIQFPQDLPDLIGDGLQIKYIVTSGEAGNIPVGAITKFYSDIYMSSDDQTVITDDMVVTNSFAAVDGSDPESLEDAYRNYKKTVGTFNTLVTCRDYENAIYNAANNYGKYLDANVVVSDRTNDINGTWNFVSTGLKGTDRILATEYPGRITHDSDTNTDIDNSIKAFDLYLYIIGNVSNSYDNKSYVDTFSINKSYSEIKDAIDENKSIQHDYKKVTGDNPFIIKNLYDVRGKLITYAKVSQSDAENIEKNVRTALYNAFNARMLEFGVAPEYDDILSVIQNADNRIKSVILDEPEYQAMIMKANVQTGAPDDPALTPWNPTWSTSEPHMDDFTKYAIAKLIANGNTQLFNFDDRFVYRFGDTFNAITSNLKSASTNLDVDGNRASQESPYTINYDVRANETIILTRASLIPQTTYTQNIWYSSARDIPGGTTYEVSSADDLHLYYTSNGVSTTVDIIDGTIIEVTLNRPGTSLPNTAGETSGRSYLRTGESITTYKKNSVTLKASDAIPCFWKVNNTENNLFSTHFSSNDSQTIYHLLQQNEYFIYSDPDFLTLSILGPGTRVEISAADLDRYDWKVEIPGITLEESSNISRGDMETVKWKYPQTDIIITEMEVVALGNGCHVEGTINEEKLSSNTLVSISEISATDEDGTTVTITPVDTSVPAEYGWYAYTRLDINSSPSNPQTLLGNQSVTLTDTSNPSVPIEIEGNSTNKPMLAFNTPLVLAGGTFIDLSVLDAGGNVQYPIMASEQGQPASGYTYNDGYVLITPSDLPNPLDSPDYKELELEIPPAGDTDKSVVSIYLSGTGSVFVEANSALSAETIESNKWKIGPGAHYFTAISEEIPDQTDQSVIVEKKLSIKITNNDLNGTLYIAPVSITGKMGDVDVTVPYYNADILPKDITESEDTYISEITSLIQQVSATDALTSSTEKLIYDYTYRANADTSHHIEKPLSSNAFWNINHPYNRFTIAQMRNCDVTVISSSKL